MKPLRSVAKVEFEASIRARTHRPIMVTPLLRFLRSMTKEQREAFASSVGTTLTYLYQLAAQPNPNPQLKLAMAIRDESKRIAKRLMTQPLTLDDLLIGAPPKDEG